MTLYDILGLSRDATPDEIRSAYRALAKQYHPDLVQQADRDTKHLAEERIKAINEAYTTLIDPIERAKYHRVMWTHRDPARRYQKIFPQRASTSNGKSQEKKTSSPEEHLLVQLSALQADLAYLSQRQHIKRRRFMAGTIISTLVVFFFMWMENLTLSTTQYTLIPRLGSFLFTFLSCELIALPILINASAIRFPNYPGLSNPIWFSMAVFVGTTLACTAIIAPREGNPMSQAAFFTGGIVISLTLLIHVYLTRRLSRLQEFMFTEEAKNLTLRIRTVERQLNDLRKK